MATHASILAWRIPWMEEPGRLQSMGLQSRTQLSDFLLLLFKLYNIQPKTGRQVFFLPPSDVYVRSFPYLLYTLIKLYYTHTHTQKKIVRIKANKGQSKIIVGGLKTPLSAIDRITTMQKISEDTGDFQTSWIN